MKVLVNSYLNAQNQIKQVWRNIRGHIDGTLMVFASAVTSVEVTKSDDTVLSFKAIYVGGDGNLVIKHSESGSAITYTGVLAGTIIPVSGVRVMAATTATDLVAMDW